MKPEDKELLFKDLSARLPYHVRCKVWLNKYGTTEEGPLDLEHNYGDVLQDAFFYHDRIKDIKPYLRPMSTMTEEEKDYVVKHSLGYTASIGGGKKDEKLYFHFKAESFDWLNAHHFDYRGLIEKGLAIEVTDENNPYKE